MGNERNAFGQALGAAVADWRPPPRPSRTAIAGRWCRLEALDPQRHGAGLYAAYAQDRQGANWTYLPYGPFASEAEYLDWLGRVSAGDDPLFYAIVTLDGRPLGAGAYLRIAPEAGSIEVGHLSFSPLLQRQPAATEAMFLMMRLAFELGYRRYEWKCNALNAPSRRAAQRLGFSFEGVFRQAQVVKGRNRDTAWYSIIDSEWPALSAAFETWLAPENFDAQGRQRQALSDLTRPLLQTVG